MKGGGVKPYYLNISKMFGDSDYNGGEIADSPEWSRLVDILKGKGLTDAQRRALFEEFGVGKSVIHYNRTLVQRKLNEMRRKAG